MHAPLVGEACADDVLTDVLSVLEAVAVAVVVVAPPVAVTVDPALPATASVPPAITAGPGAT